jgi:hypothetical protein
MFVFSKSDVLGLLMAGYSSATRQGISVGEQARDAAGAINPAATPTAQTAKKMAARAGAATMRSCMIADIKMWVKNYVP